MDKWLDNYKVMTYMNMIMYQAVYKSTIILINSIFQIGMRAVDQKLKIKLVLPKNCQCYAHCSSVPLNWTLQTTTKTSLALENVVN